MQCLIEENCNTGKSQRITEKVIHGILRGMALGGGIHRADWWVRPSRLADDGAFTTGWMGCGRAMVGGRTVGSREWL